jgi:hypothetical protein
MPLLEVDQCLILLRAEVGTDAPKQEARRRCLTGAHLPLKVHQEVLHKRGGVLGHVMTVK